MSIAEAPGLYIHVPFCARACPYCDFDFVVGREVALPRFLQAIEREIAGRPDLEERPRFGTVYLGGGTPSLLGAPGLSALLELVNRNFPGSGFEEITVEVNPEHWNAELVSVFTDFEVGRVSLGVQSFTDAGIRSLGRLHSGRQARASLESALDAGLEVSADLIVGWPGQSSALLQYDLSEIQASGISHVSVYALTIESNSIWPKLVRRGLRVLPDADEQADRLIETESALVNAGFEHYEIASYARDGSKAIHNAKYWSGVDYIGLGPSAHSAQFLPDGTVRRRGNRRGFENWMNAPMSPDLVEALVIETAAGEALWLGLRRLDGLHVPSFLRRLPGIDRAWIVARCESLLQSSVLEWSSNDVLKVAPGKWLLHDSIAQEVLA